MAGNQAFTWLRPHSSLPVPLSGNGMSVPDAGIRLIKKAEIPYSGCQLQSQKNLEHDGTHGDSDGTLKNCQPHVIVKLEKKMIGKSLPGDRRGSFVLSREVNFMKFDISTQLCFKYSLCRIQLVASSVNMIGGQLSTTCLALVLGSRMLCYNTVECRNCRSAGTDTPTETVPPLPNGQRREKERKENHEESLYGK